jgi:hypothetical protein
MKASAIDLVNGQNVIASVELEQVAELQKTPDIGLELGL